MDSTGYNKYEVKEEGENAATSRFHKIFYQALHSLINNIQIGW